MKNTKDGFELGSSLRPDSPQSDFDRFFKAVAETDKRLGQKIDKLEKMMMGKVGGDE